MLKKKHIFTYTVTNEEIINGMATVVPTDLEYNFEVYPIDQCKDYFEMYYFPYMLHNYNEESDAEILKSYIKSYKSHPIDTITADEGFLKTCISYMNAHPEFFGKSMASNFMWFEVPERNLYLVLIRKSQYSTINTSYIIPISFYTEVAGDAFALTPHVKPKSNCPIITLTDIQLEKKLDMILTKACLMNYMIDDVVSLFTFICTFIKNTYQAEVTCLSSSNTCELYLPNKGYYIYFTIGSTGIKSDFMIRGNSSKLKLNPSILFKKLFDIPEFKMKGGSFY